MDAKFFSMSRFNNFLLIDGTDRSKISNDEKRIFLLEFFANTPFKFKHMDVKLVLLSKIYSFNDIINNLAKKNISLCLHGTKSVRKKLDRFPAVVSEVLSFVGSPVQRSRYQNHH